MLHLTSLVGLVLLLVLGTFVVFHPSRYKPSRSKQAQSRYQVLVLGDIGRSPRMQYHALSIAKKGAAVDIIGYQESALLPELLASPLVRLAPLSPSPALLRSSYIPFIIAGPLKVLWQTISLVYILGYKTASAKWLVVQNPPSIPTLAVAGVVCALRNTRLLIDWHNYGWTILAGTKGASHPLVRISKLYECILGRIVPDANLTVTNAMLRELKVSPYEIETPIVAMHDRPAKLFQPIIDASKRRDSLERLAITQDMAKDIAEGRRRLVVSSTSWTPDEDFSILLEALCQYKTGPPLTAIITGKGPQRKMYEERIKLLEEQGKLKGVNIKTAFLSFEDYATLLACADLGVCLHKSSSGVDLPMKVVDMFGAGLPVAAYSGYESFSELVKEGDNGCGFETAVELSRILERLLDSDGSKELKTLKEGALKEGSQRWDDEWNNLVAPILELDSP